MLLLSNCSGVNDDWLFWYITMKTVFACGYAFDGIDHIHAFDDFTKNSIAKTLSGWA